jgi:two-component system sensor histidine kinase DesK
MTATAGRAGAGRNASWQASAIAIAVLCALLVARVAAADSTGEHGQILFVVALFVLPMLFAIPGTRRLLVWHRWPVLAIQTVLTVVPFFVFGGRWEEGVSSLLAGIVLLTLPGRVSWPLAGLLLVAELAVRAAIHGWPWTPAWSAALWVAIVFVDDCLAFFGMVRLADLVEQLQSARGRAAGLAVASERLQAAEELQAAVGERLSDVAALTTAAQHALPGNPAEARARIVAAGVTAREAVARARGVTVGRRGPVTAEPTAPAPGAVVVPRLAWAILVVLLCGFGLQSLNDIYLAHLTALPAAVLTLSIVASAVLQLHHSRQMPGTGRLRAWPLTLALQVALLYVPFLFQPIQFVGGLSGFAAGSCLLLLPRRWRWPGFTAVVVSWCVLWATVPQAGLSANPGIADTLYLVSATAGIGVLVYGLSWLTQTARDLEAVRSELARMAVLAERLRVARDVHDLLGLGLSAIALKTDLIARLIGRDDARAAAEIAEMGRICAHARADIRLVTDASRHLPLDAELAAAREILTSAGVAVHADLGAGPLPATADTVLAPVLREAVTNILRHSAATSCTIEVTATVGALRLRVGNDGVPDRAAAGGPADRAASGGPAAGAAAVGPAGLPVAGAGTGRGVPNLTARVQAAGGNLTVSQAAGRFELSAEIPVPDRVATAVAQDPRPAGAPGPPAGSR